MANVQCSLDEQLSDMRSTQIAYLFKADNRGAKPVWLRNLTPETPEGVRILTVRDTSISEELQKHREVCEKMNATLRAYLLRQNHHTNGKSAFKELFSAPVDEKSRPVEFEINSAKDAKTALTLFFKGPLEAGEPERTMFEALLTQLHEHEGRLVKDDVGQPDYIAQLAPGSSFSRTYVFEFARGQWEPRKYNIIVQASYFEVEVDGVNGSVEMAAAATSTTISPPPIVLSLIAIASSILGVVLKASLLAVAGSQSSIQRPTLSDAAWKLGEQLTASLVSLDAVAAMILAVVVFNVYEHTDFGARVKFGVGWRSALLIGVLAGLFNDRLLKALATFAGFTQAT
jgi:hypothetical protein